MLKRLLAAVCLLFIAVPSAQAANHGWYWGIEAGLNEVDTLKGLESHWIPIFYQTDTGATGLATLGTHLGPQLRLEGQVGVWWDNLTGYSNSWHEASILANVVYDLPLGADLTGSIGAGAGGDSVSGYGETKIVFAYQIIAGISWAISPNTDVTLNYHFMSASGPTFNGGGGMVDFSNIDHQGLTLGVRFAL